LTHVPSLARFPPTLPLAEDPAEPGEDDSEPFTGEESVKLEVTCCSAVLRDCVFTDIALPAVRA
jgi:hypothetical protein